VLASVKMLWGGGRRDIHRCSEWIAVIR
jgi:hypothetical protein